MTRNRHKPKINGAGGPAMTKSRKQGHGYNGNCRMIEIGRPDLPFRLVFNVDHIDSIRFEEMREEREIRVPGSVGVAEVRNEVGDVITPAVPPATRMEVVQVGWSVVITAEGASSGINFPSIDAAMGCYNSIINMIQAVGIPHVFMGALVPPKQPSGLVGPDGQAIKEAIDAVDLHADLMGDNEGDGVAENDDDLELTAEDLALLENPVIDEDGLDDVFAKPEEPPLEN